jgi:hypothetical protein
MQRMEQGDKEGKVGLENLWEKAKRVSNFVF